MDIVIDVLLLEVRFEACLEVWPVFVRYFKIENEEGLLLSFNYFASINLKCCLEDASKYISYQTLLKDLLCISLLTPHLEPAVSPVTIPFQILR